MRETPEAKAWDSFAVLLLLPLGLLMLVVSGLAWVEQYIREHWKR